jgi:hypothetical protein
LRLVALEPAPAVFRAADFVAPDFRFFALLLKISSHPAANFSVEPVCTVYPVMRCPFLLPARDPPGFLEIH